MLSKTNIVNDAVPVLEHFAARLVEERKRLGITQADLRDQTGVGRSTQVKYESGETSPDVRYLVKLGGMGFDVMYLLTGERGAAAMPVEHQNLIEAYEEAPEDVKRAVFGVLLSYRSPEIETARKAPRTAEKSGAGLPGALNEPDRQGAVGVRESREGAGLPGELKDDAGLGERQSGT
jgi:transcriptional regulator with XRE-family HTH domain